MALAIDDIAGGGGDRPKAAEFKEIGDAIVGPLIEDPVVELDPFDEQGKKDGKQRERVVLVVDDEVSGEPRTSYIRTWHARRALRTAMEASGLLQLGKGDTVGQTLVGETRIGRGTAKDYRFEVSGGGAPF